ncbi:hypothetical protein GLOIN_2v1792352 [Rhizophagus clarus]|uniref:DUF659 domain-containing protein n=1 Tax=Rhizophagus clarus TaxID=94130 RepID=A0A8H3R2A3_9GLOM|nr:hypothetical protein GLOIN_2v1792352 [Rhizophagus clarus]
MQKVGGRPLGTIWLHFERKDAIAHEKMEQNVSTVQQYGNENALVKFFVACGVSFRIIEHPFFIDFVKELNTAYNLTLEYLYQLSDLSLNLHTAAYLTEKIEDILENIGPKHISAIVSDNAVNVCNARTKIQKKYPHIKNIYCISYCINLVANDIVNHAFANRFLCGGLKSYCKTRWTTSSESVNLVLDLKLVLEKMIMEHANCLTKTKVKVIIEGCNFWSDLKILAFVLDPLRKAILALEA